MPDILTKDDLGAVLKPIEAARGLPNVCYTDTPVFELERRRIFAGGWACAGFAHDVAGTGALYPFEFAGMPLLMVRVEAPGEPNSLRVFHNVCRHRGRILVPAPKSVKKAIICPYHGWSYDLSGSLVRAPNVGGTGVHRHDGFEAGDICLSEVRSAEWFGLVFIDLSGQAEAFDEYIGPVNERWQDFAGATLTHGGDDSTIRIDLACNWKLAVENDCEAYHLPFVHPELNKYSPLDQHYCIVDEAHSGQRSEVYAPTYPAGQPIFPNAPGLPSSWDTAADYVALYPNVLLGIHRDHFFAVLLEPEGPTRTHERFEIFYFDHAVRDTAFDATRIANRDLWQSVFAEDRDAVESMQRGRASPGFDGGVFSPVMDAATHAFHVWMATRLQNDIA
jgi:choline monooxygenase